MLKSTLVSFAILLIVSLFESAILSNIIYFPAIPDILLLCSMYFSLLHLILRFLSASNHAGNPPKSHSAQIYGPGLTITYNPSFAAMEINLAISNMPSKQNSPSFGS